MTENTGATITLGNASGSVVNANGIQIVSYRGEENFWGNIWWWIDGINHYANATTGECETYVADHGFADDIKTAPYEDTGMTAKYGNEGALHAWDLRQISIPPCSCRTTAELYVKYLQSAFSEIRILNEKWHRNYFSFDSVPVTTPECFPDSAETIMYQNFLRLREESFFQEVVSFFQNHSSKQAEIFLSPKLTSLAEARNIAVSVPLEQNVPESEQTLALACASDSFRKASLKIREQTTVPEMEVCEKLQPSRLYRFLWNAAAYGADELILGEWDRDSIGNLLASDDFYYAERKKFLLRFSGEMERFRSLLDHWEPDRGSAAIFRSRMSEQFLKIRGISLKQAQNSLRGWIRSFSESSTPFTSCEEDSLHLLEDKKLLILPGTPILTREAASAILDFVYRGGTLVCEPECGAWSSTGVALRPDSRFCAEAFGVCEMERQSVPDSSLQFKFGKQTVSLNLSGYVVPLKTVKKYTEVLVPYRNDAALVERISYGEGNILLLGAFVGTSAMAVRSPGLEDFLNSLLNKVSPEFNLITRNCRAIPGLSGKNKMLFLFASENAEKIEISFSKSFWKKHALKDLITGKKVVVSANGMSRNIRFVPDASGVAVLCEELKNG